MVKYASASRADIEGDCRRRRACGSPSPMTGPASTRPGRQTSRVGYAGWTTGRRCRVDGLRWTHRPAAEPGSGGRSASAAPAGNGFAHTADSARTARAVMTGRWRAEWLRIRLLCAAEIRHRAGGVRRGGTVLVPRTQCHQRECHQPEWYRPEFQHPNAAVAGSCRDSRGGRGLLAAPGAVEQARRHGSAGRAGRWLRGGTGAAATDVDNPAGGRHRAGPRRDRWPHHAFRPAPRSGCCCPMAIRGRRSGPRWRPRTDRR